jgi:four helix bundle protein
MAQRLRRGYAPEGQKRRYVAHFVSKLTDADGLRLVAYASEREQAETQHWLYTAAACDYTSEKEQNALLGKCKRIGQMLGSMIAKPEKFCRRQS